MGLNVSRDVYLQIEKKCFQRSLSRFPLFLKPSAPCVGFCRPGKRRCEYSSEPHEQFYFHPAFLSFQQQGRRCLACVHFRVGVAGLCTPHSFGLDNRCPVSLFLTIQIIFAQYLFSKGWESGREPCRGKKK